MQEAQSAAQWAELMHSFRPSEWADLPDLDLYMDQVITLLSRELSPFSVAADKPLTSNMINNYVKDGILDRPERKKYNKDHFACLMILCQLKSILSIPEVDTLLRSLPGEDDHAPFFDRFVALRQELAQDMAKEVLKLPADDHNARMEAALRFALTASLFRCAAAHLITDEKKAKEQAKKADPAAEKKKNPEKAKEHGHKNAQETAK